MNLTSLSALSEALTESLYSSLTATLFSERAPLLPALPGCSLLPVRLCLSGGVQVAPGDGQTASFEVARCGTGGPA